MNKGKWSHVAMLAFIVLSPILAFAEGNAGDFSNHSGDYTTEDAGTSGGHFGEGHTSQGGGESDTSGDSGGDGANDGGAGGGESE